MEDGSEVAQHVHDSIDVTSYCTVCDMLACKVCAANIHGSHVVEDLQQADKRFASQLASSLSSLQHLRAQCQVKLALIHEAMKQLDADSEKLLLTTNQFADKMKSEIQAKCNEILAKAESSRESVTQAIKSQRAQETQALNICLTDTQNVMERVEKTIIDLESNLTSDASVVQKYSSKKSASSIDDSLIRTKIQYESINTNTWKTDLIAWQKPIKEVLTKAAKTAPILKINNAPRSVVQQRVTSVEHLGDMAVGERMGGVGSADVMSLSAKGMLAVGYSTFSKLAIYRVADRSHVATLDLPGGDRPFDVTWTRDGNLVYTCNNKSDDVVVISQQGGVVTRNQVSDASSLSVCADGTLYLASGSQGVYESTDGGLSWSFVFKPLDRWKSIQIMRVSSTGNTDEFWSLDDCFDLHIRRVRVYTVDRSKKTEAEAGGSEPISREVFTMLRLSDLDGVDYRCRLAYDGSTVFLSNWSECSVHALPLSGKGECLLLSAKQLANNRPCRLGVDGGVLYLGLQDGGIVSVFALRQKFA